MQEPISQTIDPFSPYEPAAPIEVVKPTPNDPPWGSGVAIGMWFTSVLLIIIVPALFLAPYAISLASQNSDSADLVKSLSTDPTAIVLQVLAIIPAHLITILLAWMLVTQGRKYSFRDTLGWESGGMRWWHYVVILVGFFCLAAVVGNYLPEQETELTRILKSSRSAVFLVAFMATFTAPLVEEVIYRGVLYSALQRTVGVNAAIGLVTFLFALVHVPQYLESASTLILLAILSLILTLVRVRTGNLLPCVILHTLFNGIQSVLLIAEPYLGLDPKPENAISAITLIFK